MTADIAWLLIAFFFTLLFLWALLKLHADPSVDFDLTDVLKKDERVSRQAIIEVGAFMATTFVLIHQELEGTLTDTYVAAYGTFWILKGLTQVVVGAKRPTPPPEEPRK